MAHVDASKIWSLNYRVLLSVISSAEPDITALGIESKELFLLAEVDEHPYPAELAVTLSMPKPTVTVYLKRLEAAGFVRRETARYTSPGVTVKGTISYTGTSVAGVYFGTGADVLSCVDASAFHQVNPQTGATMGPALPTRLTRYLENVAEERGSNGTWSVTRLAIYPATSTKGAMCR